MTPRLVMLHGWGLDAALWDGVRAALPDYETWAVDRGYFGAPADRPPDGPFVAVGHSLGALMMADLPAAIGHIAINGFDRFAGDDAVPPRVVERMRRRFAEHPAAVLADFRLRIGADAAPQSIDAARLATDLQILAEADRRAASRPRTLVLHGGMDPLLPAAMRETVFAGAPRDTVADGGHLLPLTHPTWCADRIRAFVA
ncbi:alpha/beta fold hydrolase [Sphingomonas abietis]|uniref:Alpha/beta fold hydrolase n=1 Tax=Sphingomonas abietis TaxID=3012344 RepID=A0ABY7NP49_9SPHN|nr:alpha/beta fold hydrolase [Sphingomonas abietis]WBO23303.1 alpha/beta fold hydrolase [Sphingomonas abietis]